MIALDNGILLIAEPFLKDHSFFRSVVLICKHDEEFGTFGFVINRKLQTTLNQIVKDMDGFELPVFMGGPVENDSLHYIHQYPQYLEDAVPITDDVYWGGDFEILKKLIKEGTVDTSKIKFFLGYSGWDAGQLQDEMTEDSWITFAGHKDIMFDNDSDNIWKECLTQLGGKYKQMIHYPSDPQLN